MDIAWEELNFDYMNLPYRYIAKYKDGKWEPGKLVEDNMIPINESAPALHYGQQCFEGLKAYRRADGDINVFRVEENALRMQRSANRLFMPAPDISMFKEAILEVVKANEAYVPPYGSGATLYIRPVLFGVGENLGVKPANEYLFIVFASPVGAYFKTGFKPGDYLVLDYDRAAGKGTGDVKVGGNYAASLLPGKIAKEEGYCDCIYLDPQTHTNIEEVGAANFFAITKDNTFVTPKSNSILPSITKKSLLDLAKDRFNLKVEERDIPITSLDEFKEAGACGTAAVISPIGSITYNDKKYVFGDGKQVGELTQKLYDELVGIQFGDITPPKDWIEIIKVDK